MSNAALTGDEAVAQNIDRADKVQSLDGDVHAMTEAHGGPETGEHHAEPSLWGAGPGAIVSLAMAVFLLVLLLKKVPGAMAKGLDGKIAEIRKNLDEAARLRAEAEALKAEYERKVAAAEGEIAAMRAQAEHDAAQVIANAETDAAALVKRRQKMAEDKIGAAERSAIADIRAKTVAAASAAAAALVAQTHDAASDQALVDATIKAL